MCSITYMILESAKLLGAGLATISIAGTGIGVGIIFAALIGAYSRTYDATPWAVIGNSEVFEIILIA